MTPAALAERLNARPEPAGTVGAFTNGTWTATTADGADCSRCGAEVHGPCVTSDTRECGEVVYCLACAERVALRPVRFTFDDARAFDGLTDGTEWNGFLNVLVTPETHAAVIAYLLACEHDAEVMAEMAALPVRDGLVSYANGYATMEADDDDDENDRCRFCGRIVPDCAGECDECVR